MYVILFLEGSSSFLSFDNSSELSVIQKADLENHNKEGGLWVVIHGKVFDLQEFKDQVGWKIHLLYNCLRWIIIDSRKRIGKFVWRAVISELMFVVNSSVFSSYILVNEEIPH